MIVNNEFKQLIEIIENRNGSLVAPRGKIASFKYRHNSRFLPYSREILLSQGQVKYMLRNRNKNSLTAFYDKPRYIIKSDRFRRCETLNGFANI
jgi:hypothetical protein